MRYMIQLPLMPTKITNRKHIPKFQDIKNRFGIQREHTWNIKKAFLRTPLHETLQSSFI